MLLGYLPEVIQDTSGTARTLDLEIDYSVTAPDDLTRPPLQVARDRIEESFLLLYCDNYWPLDMDAHWERYCSSACQS